MLCGLLTPLSGPTSAERSASGRSLSLCPAGSSPPLQTHAASSDSRTSCVSGKKNLLSHRNCNIIIPAKQLGFARLGLWFHASPVASPPPPSATVHHYIHPHSHPSYTLPLTLIDAPHFGFTQSPPELWRIAQSPTCGSTSPAGGGQPSFAQPSSGPT